MNKNYIELSLEDENNETTTSTSNTDTTTNTNTNTNSLIANNSNENLKLLQSFIFSTHKSSKATLIDISNIRNNDFSSIAVPEQFKFKLKLGHTFSNTYNSMVTIRDNLYIFGGDENAYNQRYYIFSLKSKSIEHQGSMKKITGGCRISACHDGLDHIYLVNGIYSHYAQQLSRIDRFNIRTQTFEHYHSLPLTQYEVQILSFFYNGILYALEERRSRLMIFNPHFKTLETYKITELKREKHGLKNLFFPILKLACTDERGNIYIYHEMSRFVRFNVDTKEIVELTPIALDKKIGFTVKVTLLYHEASVNDSYIFFMGGKDLGNFAYSVNLQTWSKFYETDEFHRLAYGSAIVSLYN